jgi:hypothetical protein
LKATARENYKLDLVDVEEMKWKKGGTERVEDYTLFFAQSNEDYQLGQIFSYIRISKEPLGKLSLLEKGCRFYY